MKRYIRNILACYSRAKPEEISEGKDWYAIAYEIAASLSPSVSIGAGVISALSPNQSWKTNISLARYVLDSGDFTYGTYGANLRKAERIVNGENPLIVLHGWKTISFYCAILSSGLDSQFVTVDRHAIAICLNRVPTDKERGKLRSTPKGKKLYDSFAQAYRDAAKETGLTPSQLQAITWLTWRREKRIKPDEK